MEKKKREKEKERERESTVWLNKHMVEKNPTPYWTLSDVSRTNKQYEEEEKEKRERERERARYG